MKNFLFPMLCLLVSCLCPAAAAAQVPDVDYAPRLTTLLSYNVRNATADDGSVDFEDVVATIRSSRADVVALQELDSVTGRSGGKDVLRELAWRSQYYPAYGPAIEYDGGRYGLGLLSRERPLSVRQIALPGREEKRTMLMAEFKDYVVACVHLSLTREDREASARVIAGEAARWAKPFVLAGDLNDELGSAFMKSLSEHFDVVSSAKPTFPSRKPKVCIDHIAVYRTDAQPLVVRESKVLAKGKVSDHLPTMVRWQMKTDAQDILYGRPYLQNVSSHGATVMFQSNTRVHAWVEYGRDTLALASGSMLYGGQAVCHSLEHRVRLDSLMPGERYFYRVCAREILHYGAYNKVFGNTVKTGFYSFVPPAEDVDGFTALVLNDLHTDVSTIERMAGLASGIPHDFVVFNGDCMPDPGSRSEALAMLHRLVSAFNASEVPCVFIRGNHEIRNAYSAALPSLLEHAGGDTYGAFSWGDTRFVVLDCGEDKPDSTWVYYGLNDFTAFRQAQYDFLKDELGGREFRKAKARVLLNHIPLWGNGDKYQPCPKLWGGLLEKAGFDVNLSGHTHRFRFHPVGDKGNPFPVCIGGGPSQGKATMFVLTKMGKNLTLRVLDAQGNEKGCWEL